MKRRALVKILLAVALLAFGTYYILTFALPVYTYESSDRGMAEHEIPWKGKKLDMVTRRFEEYKSMKDDPDLKLYRTCNKMWSASNLWWDNLTNKRWSLPYMEPSAEPNYDWRPVWTNWTEKETR